MIKLWIFENKLAKTLIKTSYTNEKTCGSPENSRKRQLSHILETAPIHDTECNGKTGFAQGNIDSNNTSAFFQIVKNTYDHVARVAWERVCSKSITLYIFWRKLQAII